MKTLADLKRALSVVGTKFECEQHLASLSGIRQSGEREVASVQTNAISYWFQKQYADGTTRRALGWCQWGKAAEWRIAGNRATYVERDTRSIPTTYTDIFTYIITPEVR